VACAASGSCHFLVLVSILGSVSFMRGKKVMAKNSRFFCEVVL
jgi:hypothetical protein